jgi:DNA-binding NarL/FixJ family response regulator
MFAEGLACALSDHADFDVSEKCSTSVSEILRCVAGRRPGVALVDFWISDIPGPAVARAILNVSPLTRILFLSELSVGPVEREQAQAAGALSFLPKEHLAIDDVVATIRSVAATPVARSLRQGDDHTERVLLLMTLSPREVEVLQSLRRCLSLREVATELSISPGTVKNHIHNVLVKTKSRSQLEAMIVAEEEGWISSD